LKGGVLKRDEEDKYSPRGFILSELGPIALRGCGKEKMEADNQKLNVCP
jgi:hypothetical protein